MPDPVLVIDDDRHLDAALISRFAEAGIEVDVAEDGLSAIEKLKRQHYSAVILDPMIRHGLNGYVVLNYIELEQPDIIEHVFLLTGMSEQTIARTVPSLLPRLFRKSSDTGELAAAVLDACDSPKAAPSAQSLLLIEDDDTTAALLQGVAEELGYRVMVARTGKEALQHLASDEYAAVMLDLVMPDVDGFAILEYLQSTRPHLLRRVIVTTGMPDRYASSIDRSRICALLHKPIDTRQLSAALQRCVGFEPGGEHPRRSDDH